MILAIFFAWDRGDGSALLMNLWTYKRVGQDVVFLQHRRGQLGVPVVIVLDEGRVAHAWLLLDEDRRFGHFPETRRVGISGFEDHSHVATRRCGSVRCMIELSKSSTTWSSIGKRCPCFRYEVSHQHSSATKDRSSRRVLQPCFSGEAPESAQTPVRDGSDVDRAFDIIDQACTCSCPYHYQ
nr:hypothetical protein CFP56_30846 [Quercus suber]